MNVLVLDVGTSSMRGILFDQSGKQIFEMKIKYQPCHKSGTWIEQNPDDFKNALEQIVQNAAYREDGMTAIAVTAQRSSIIPVDKTGKPLMNAIMWQDSRNADICREIERQNETVRELSGAPVNMVFSGGKMAWIRKERPDIYEAAYKLVNIPEYLIYLMTGEFVSDYTYGSRSNLMNLRERCWDKKLLEIFHIDSEKLCDLQEPGSICGRVTELFAARTGIKSKIPVISAGGDQQCAAIGQGAFQPGVLSIVTGTGAFMVSSCDKVPDKIDSQLICNCSSVPGSYILEASVLTCCSALDWYRENFYENDIDFCQVNKDLDTLYNLQEDCIALPYFQGEINRAGGTYARAFFGNIALSTKRSNILKALVEGVFLEIKNYIDRFGKYVEIVSANIGGGMTNSKIMNQMQADIYGLKLFRMEDSESTALGALVIALTSLGIYKDIPEAYRRIWECKTREVYIPDMEKAARYRRKQEDMNGMYEKIYGQDGGKCNEQNQ